MYAYRLSAGRWFTAADAGAGAGTGPPPVVLGPGAAHAIGAWVGQVVTLTTPAGSGRFRVIGIDTGQSNAGRDIYFPLAVLQRLSGLGDAVNALWLTTASARPLGVDRATTAVQNRLTAAGYSITAQERYRQEANIQSQDNAFISIIEFLGLLVVAITLIGLVNALTMSVIDRTREVGVLRCLGAKARQVRRVFERRGSRASHSWLGARRATSRADRPPRTDARRPRHRRFRAGRLPCRQRPGGARRDAGDHPAGHPPVPAPRDEDPARCGAALPVIDSRSRVMT